MKTLFIMVFIENNNVFVLTILLLIMLSVVGSLEECLPLTPRKKGNCINLNKCESLKSLINQEATSPWVNTMIKLVQCGFDGKNIKVCCEVNEMKNEISQHVTSTILPTTTLLPDINSKGNDCMTPWVSLGTCKTIVKCRIMMHLMTYQPQTDIHRLILQSAKCGMDGIIPKVCCENEKAETIKIPSDDFNEKVVKLSDSKFDCQTPSNRPGVCINIKNCKKMLKLMDEKPLTNTSLVLLKNSICEFDDMIPKFCCEIEEEKDDNILDFSEFILEQSLAENFDSLRDHSNFGLLDHDRCGPTIDLKSMGAADTSIYEFPWMALLEYTTDEVFEFRCGASLINKRYVLTAAHCVTGLAPGVELSKVRLGDYDLDNERDCDSKGICIDKYQEYNVEHVHVHPEYSRKQHQNDIALVRLEGEADLNQYNVRPICLPLGNAATPYKFTNNFIVSGWDSIGSESTGNKLRKISLPLVENARCRLIYKKYPSIKISMKHICAGGLKNIDSCSGDSGGPLQAIGIYNDRPSYVQYGIVSFGPKPCGVKGFPGVYTRVVYYVKWILDTITN